MEMYFDWTHNEPIGFHEVVLRHHNGEKVPATQISLWDYAHPPRRTDLPHYLRDVAFVWKWCHGWSHSVSHKLSENLTLQDVQREIELWTMQRYVEAYKAALKSVEELKPYAEWAEEQMKGATKL